MRLAYSMRRACNLQLPIGRAFRIRLVDHMHASVLNGELETVSDGAAQHA